MFVLFFIFISIIAYAQTKDVGITFEFENGQVIEENSEQYYSFDVVAYTSGEDSYFGSGMVYFFYSTESFGENVCSTDNIVVEKGQLINGELAPGAPLYEIINITDNTSSCAAITTVYNFPTNPNQANMLSTTPTQYLHIKLKILDITGFSELSFYENLMIGQQYQSNDIIKYIPVVATDTDNIDLPVNQPPEAGEESSSINIFQSIPNPFGPKSNNISLTIIPPKQGSLKLSVFNIRGQLIKTLYDENVQKNQEISFNWRGIDDDGNDLPSGIYFYKLIIEGEFIKTQKFIITK
ncbi:MAG: T9SS type A sorting domain-containing protein [Candidatus Cloacimonetes bacterium]|nr:T9SS type A sorting domain-containing protein [Candidatus Cloacimonadota bacterium]